MNARAGSPDAEVLWQLLLLYQLCQVLQSVGLFPLLARCVTILSNNVDATLPTCGGRRLHTVPARLYQTIVEPHSLYKVFVCIRQPGGVHMCGI